jgi:deoxyadenosine/deoxycytidine kinase
MSFIISVEGNIGSGKTTLLNHIEQTKNFQLVYEDVDSWKDEGWLELFYSNITRYAGTFQLRTQISHMENKKKFVKDKINVVERSPLSNKYIFGSMLNEDKFLHKLEYDVIGKVNDLIGWTPDYVVVLLCDPKVCYERIQKRNRPGENIPSMHYLEALHNKHLELAKMFESKTFIIDTTNLTPQQIMDEFLNHVKIMQECPRSRKEEEDEDEDEDKDKDQDDVIIF